MSTPLPERLGRLSERPFRLLFSATTISTFGDAVEHTALAFAVLAHRPKRPLFASVIVCWPILLQLSASPLYAPVWLLAAAAFLSGARIAMHLAPWFTVFQREVPAHAQSRVSSYDALGSFVLIRWGWPPPARRGPDRRAANAVGASRSLSSVSSRRR